MLDNIASKELLTETILTPQSAIMLSTKSHLCLLPSSRPPVLSPGQQSYNILQYSVQLCQNGITLIACDSRHLYWDFWKHYSISLCEVAEKEHSQPPCPNLLFLCALPSKMGPKSCSLYYFTDGNYIREKPSKKEVLARNVPFMLYSIKHSKITDWYLQNYVLHIPIHSGCCNADLICTPDWQYKTKHLKTY